MVEGSARSAYIAVHEEGTPNARSRVLTDPSSAGEPQRPLWKFWVVWAVGAVVLVVPLLVTAGILGALGSRNSAAASVSSAPSSSSSLRAFGQHEATEPLFVHLGRCRGSPLLGQYGAQDAVQDCSKRCSERGTCAYLSFDSTSGGCLLYSLANGCPLDQGDTQHKSYMLPQDEQASSCRGAGVGQARGRAGLQGRGRCCGRCRRWRCHRCRGAGVGQAKPVPEPFSPPCRGGWRWRRQGRGQGRGAGLFVFDEDCDHDDEENDDEHPSVDDQDPHHHGDQHPHAD